MRRLAALGVWAVVCVGACVPNYPYQGADCTTEADCPSSMKCVAFEDDKSRCEWTCNEASDCIGDQGCDEDLKICYVIVSTGP